MNCQGASLCHCFCCENIYGTLIAIIETKYFSGIIAIPPLRMDGIQIIKSGQNCIFFIWRLKCIISLYWADHGVWYFHHGTIGILDTFVQIFKDIQKLNNSTIRQFDDSRHILKMVHESKIYWLCYNGKTLAAKNMQQVDRSKYFFSFHTLYLRLSSVSILSLRKNWILC